MIVRCLTIAGSDSGGGAGIQADLRTFTALHCFGTSAITAVTAQNTRGVAGIWELPPKAVADQITAVLSDIGADAMKVGMLQSRAIVRAVVEALRHFPHIPLVVDPVMIAKGGAPLLQRDAVEALRAELLPLALVVTPNLPEAGALLGRDVATALEMEDAARAIRALGAANVVVKGGHGEGVESRDFVALASPAKSFWLSAPRVKTPNTHGTGCTFSAAVTAHLALGQSVEEAVRQGKCFITEALQRGKGITLGHGHGPAFIAAEK